MILFVLSRRGRLAVAAVAVSLAVSTAAQAQTFPQADIDQIDQLIEEYIDVRAALALGRVPPICIGYIASATQFNRRCAGETRRDWASEFAFPPATTFANDQTLFRVGSLSKLFTGSLLAARKLDAAGMTGGCSHPEALCYEERLVTHIDEDPNDCVKDCDDKAHITLRELARHQSRIPRNGSAFPVLRYDDALLLADFGLVELDTTAAYSNMGFALLAKALEDGTSQSYRTQVKNRLLTPLGMVHTMVEPAVADFPRLAQAPGYQVADGDAWGPAFAGSGGYHSNLDDMMQFLRWHLGYVSVASINAIRGETVDNRLGWGVTDWAPGATGDLVHKDGASTGFKAYIGYLRNTGRGVVVLLAGSDDPEWIATDVLKLLR